MKEKRLYCAGEQTHAEIKIKNCIAGFTPLILGATAGHLEVVEILLDHGADIEAQSERTKDTPLSLACSGGRYEVGFVRVSVWLDVFDLCVCTSVVSVAQGADTRWDLTECVSVWTC